MTQIKAVLFDLDGTLIDSIDNIVACWQHVMRTLFSTEITREEILPKVGLTLKDAFEEVAPGRSDEMFAMYRAHQHVTHDEMIKLIPGTKETLSHLKGHGMMLGVVTSKGLPTATRGMNLFDLVPFFDTLVTIEDTKRHKPAPDPLLLACERLDLQPAEAIYVGDALMDIMCGKAAGTHTAAVTWGAGSRDALVAAAPDYVFDTMPEVTSLLLPEVGMKPAHYSGGESEA